MRWLAALALCADPKVADAAFALAEGKSSGPIQGQLGLAPGTPAESRKPMLVTY